MTRCPFYGMHDTQIAGLMPTHGNQCAVTRIAFAPCAMEIIGHPIEWRTCSYRNTEQDHCIAQCVGCGSESHICGGGNPANCDWWRLQGLCQSCLHRAELLALEAAGQGRLFA